MAAALVLCAFAFFTYNSFVLNPSAKVARRRRGTAAVKLKLQKPNYIAPPNPGAATKTNECPQLNAVCDCPPSTWALPSINAIPSREQTCANLRAESHILFASDSIIRDTWSAAAMWLLALDRFNISALSVGPRAVCMSSAWRFLEPEGIISAVQSAGFLRETLTTEKSISTFLVCQGKLRLTFRYARLFSDLPAIFDDMRTEGATALIISHGILELSDYPTVGALETRTRKWAKDLDAHARNQRMPIVFLGAHARIAELTPPEFSQAAHGSQGNTVLRRQYLTVASEATSGGLRVVDAFRLTAALNASYRDTDDGLHFGLWVNLQRFWLAALCLNDTGRCSQPAV